MRFTYISSDKSIGIDGEFYYIDNITFDPDISAIQWYDTYGEIEFFDKDKKSNQIFKEESFIAPLVDSWNLKKQELTKLQVQTPINNSVDDLFLEEDKNNFIQKNQNIINNG